MTLDKPFSFPSVKWGNGNTLFQKGVGRASPFQTVKQVDRSPIRSPRCFTASCINPASAPNTGLLVWILDLYFLASLVWLWHRVGEQQTAGTFGQLLNAEARWSGHVSSSFMEELMLQAPLP